MPKLDYYDRKVLILVESYDETIGEPLTSLSMEFVRPGKMNSKKMLSKGYLSDGSKAVRLITNPEDYDASKDDTYMGDLYYGEYGFHNGVSRMYTWGVFEHRSPGPANEGTGHQALPVDYQAEVYGLEDMYNYAYIREGFQYQAGQSIECFLGYNRYTPVKEEPTIIEDSVNY